MIRRVAWMTRIKQRTAEYRISNDGIALRGVGVRTPTSRRLREIFFKIDRIHSFDVRCWSFDVRCSSVSFSIRLPAFQGRVGPSGPGYLLKPAVTRVFILAHPVMLKIFITGAVSQKAAKPSVWTIDHIPMGRFDELTGGLFREFIHLFRTPNFSGIACKGSLFWMGCAGN